MHQVWEKYLSLAQDAAVSGDRILAEGYYQHAEHYYRLLNANAGNGSNAGGNKSKEQPQPSEAQNSSDSSRRRNGASRDENHAEADVGAEAEVTPRKTSAKASSENSEEMANATFDDRDALTIFPDTSNTAEREADAAEEAPIDGPDKDAEDSDPVAAK